MGIDGSLSPMTEVSSHHGSLTNFVATEQPLDWHFWSGSVAMLHVSAIEDRPEDDMDLVSGLEAFLDISWTRSNRCRFSLYFLLCATFFSKCQMCSMMFNAARKFQLRGLSRGWTSSEFSYVFLLYYIVLNIAKLFAPKYQSCHDQHPSTPRVSHGGALLAHGPGSIADVLRTGRCKNGLWSRTATTMDSQSWQGFVEI